MKILEAFSSWPIDSVIVFIAICLALVLMVLGFLIPTRVSKNDPRGFMPINTSIGGHFVTAGFLMGALAIMYATTKAQNTPAMPDNLFYAKIVSTFFAGAAIYVLYGCLTHYEFNHEFFVVHSPLSGEKRYRWVQLETTGLWIDTPYVKFKDARRIFISRYLKRGIAQFNTFMALKANSIDVVPYNPMDHDPRRLRELIGKKILINIVYVDSEYLEYPATQLVGVVQSIFPNRIEVKCEHAKLDYFAAANISTIQFLPDREKARFAADFGISPDQAPDLIGLWFSQDPKYQLLDEASPEGSIEDFNRSRHPL